MPGDVTVPKELDSMLFIASQPVEHASEFETVTVIPTGRIKTLTTIIHRAESGKQLARATC